MDSMLTDIKGGEWGIPTADNTADLQALLRRPRRYYDPRLDPRVSAMARARAMQHQSQSRVGAEGLASFNDRRFDEFSGEKPAVPSWLKWTLAAALVAVVGVVGVKAAAVIAL